jgi:C4-dicarboxylate transporter
VEVKLLPGAMQAPALGATLREVNDSACWVSSVACRATFVLAMTASLPMGLGVNK